MKFAVFDASDEGANALIAETLVWLLSLGVLAPSYTKRRGFEYFERYACFWYLLWVVLPVCLPTRDDYLWVHMLFSLGVAIAFASSTRARRDKRILATLVLGPAAMQTLRLANLCIGVQLPSITMLERINLARNAAGLIEFVLATVSGLVARAMAAFELFMLYVGFACCSFLYVLLAVGCRQDFYCRDLPPFPCDDIFSLH